MSTPWFRFIIARFSFFHEKYRLNNSENSKNNVLYFPFFGNYIFYSIILDIYANLSEIFTVRLMVEKWYFKKLKFYRR